MRAVLRVLLNAYDYLVLYLGLAWLGILCLAWTPIALIIAPDPPCLLDVVVVISRLPTDPTPSLPFLSPS